MVVLITGGTRGIGLAAVQAFLAQGHKVAFCGTSKETVKQALAKIGPGDVLGGVADVSDPQQVEKFVAEVIAKYGRIDVLVNNAGVLWGGRFAEQDYASMERLTDVNVNGVLYCSRAVLPQMIKQKSGVIINVASSAGRRGTRGLAAYSASKFAVVGFTQAVAQEVGKHGVRVYGLCPGPVRTDMVRHLWWGKFGVSAASVAKRILALAGETPPIAPGQCL